MASTSDFILSPCTPSDIDSMVHVYHTAFAKDPIGLYMWPNFTPEKEIWLKERFAKNFLQPEIRHFKITEASTGNLAAWSRWGFPFTLTAEGREREREGEGEGRGKEEGKANKKWFEGANEEVCDAFFGGLERFKKKYVNEGEMYVVYFLATDPAYQRKGLGNMLLKHGLALADAEGKKIYIEASAEGRPLYIKLGWEDIDLLTVDLTKWGAKEPGYNWIMMRDPQTPQ